MFMALAGLAATSAALRAEVAADGFRIIRAARRRLPLLGDAAHETEAWIFNEPVIRATQGQEAKFRIINELEVDLWLHWFGVRGPADQMTINVAPGEANATDCIFTPPDAGTFWLGPMAEQSRLRDMGLAAMFIVAEVSPIAGVSDLPLILDDWKIDEQGVIDQDFGDMDLVVGEGRLGNWFTINGAFRPQLALADGSFTRLRLLNAANSRDMLIQFKGADPMLVALDGQPVAPRFLGQQSFAISPGQRADLLVDGTGGDTRLAVDLFEDVVEIGTLVSGGTAPMPDLADNFALPANPVAAPIDLANAITVALVIEGGEKGGMTGALHNGTQMDLRGLLESGMAWAINGAAGAAGPSLGDFRAGSTVLIAVENRTIFDQPLHIHGHVWRVIERVGTVLEHEPLRDTAVIAGKSAAKLAFVADNAGQWAIQSLIAERADAGLAVAFTVA
jgi:FtsP/CotA-like multicopper oxidase with cupredoxin domain